MENKQLNMVLNDFHKGILNIECDEEMSNTIQEILITNNPSIGILYKEDALYENMKVREYLRFFAQLDKQDKLLDDAISFMNLHELLHTKIKKLTYSQKRKVAIAREIILNKPMYLLEEPLLNLDHDSTTCVLEWIDKIIDHKQIITTSISLKHICLLPGTSYYLSNDEMRLIDNVETTQDNNQDVVVEKISAKLEDKILLFNPNEIDFIESIDGKSYLNVRSNSFPCSLTLDELEAKLKRFGFFRSHRSYLVNMQKVTEVVRWTRNSYSLKINGHIDENVPLSKGRIDEMKELYHF